MEIADRQGASQVVQTFIEQLGKVTLPLGMEEGARHKLFAGLAVVREIDSLPSRLRLCAGMTGGDGECVDVWINSGSADVVNTQNRQSPAMPDHHAGKRA